MPRRLLSLAGLALWMASAVATADDKDLLKKGTAPPNLLIVFGNSETTEQPIQGSTSAWDGDGDSPVSKMGAAKQVVKQFVSQKHTTFNIGMSAFTHGASSSNVVLTSKHWLYSPLTVDFPSETWKEPIGTIERWGRVGEGPCTNLSVSACAGQSSNFVTLPAGVAGAIGPFFGVPTASAFIYLDGTTDSKGQPQNATKRIMVTLLPVGKYGDAFTDGTLSSYTLPAVGTIPAHSMEVTKVYQQLVGNGNSAAWVTQSTTPNGSPGTVTVFYVPSATLIKPDFFYATGTDAGKEIGFLNDDAAIVKQNRDLSVGGDCSGWEFQSSNAPLPLIKIPRDYKFGATCAPPQDSLPCVNRLMRPQAKLVSYNQATGIFTPNDYDNPGYLTNDDTHKYDDGCDKNLLGAPDAGLNDIGRQAILITQNGNQAPIKNLLVSIYQYFTKSAIDGFQNGARSDDPNKACRKTAVILIYDTFNGCQGDPCEPSFIGSAETPLKQIGVPVYVIGFGASATANASSGICIAQNTGAFQADGTTPGYYPVTDAAGLLQALGDISSILDQATQTFATAAVSTSQALGDQTAYFASFSATKDRSIWNGRLGAYKLDATGNVVLGPYTVKDANDPANLITLQVPSNDPASLKWNAGANLLQTPGTGANTPSAILAPGATISTGTYTDDSNDTVTTIPTHYYSGRKIVFSLPQGYTSPVTTLPIPAGNKVPENRYDMTFDTSNSKFSWSDLKALLAPQTSPPSVGPALTDTDAGNSLRFIWGDRDPVTGATQGGQKYCSGTSCQKLGDIFHSAPLLVGGPNDFFFFKTNVQGYAAYSSAYQNRRRVLYVGANDGLLHAFDAGAFGRDTSKPTEYDLGTGTELFAFAPRAIMQIYKPLKDAVGPQTKNDEWTVDLSPSAADVFMDANHSGTPAPGQRSWHTVLVGGVREGSPFEGTGGIAPKNSQGSYYALDITQPDELVSGVESPGTTAAPKCLNASFDSTCARDWPTVLWEITDTGDQDASGSPGAGFPDMGETWAKAAMGRVKICTANCGNTSSPLPNFEDHYVAIFGGGFDRERLNRRGNWIYMVDIETGKALYKVNSSCGGDPIVSGCTPTYFGSVPSEPAALDYNDDGYLDVIYVGDLKGRLWRIDLTDLRKLSSPPSGSFRNQLDLVNGSGKPFLFFQAGPATLPNANAFYPMYFRPEAINLGYNSGGRPALGIAFGTGDRDDIQGTVDSTSLTYKQRFYYVIDTANTTTTTESSCVCPCTSGLLDITTPTALSSTCVPARGWFLELTNGERVVGDTLAPGGVIRFPTYNPLNATTGGDACGNGVKCTISAGTSRQYQVYYNTGNAYLGASDRGQTQPYAMFITSMTSYLSGSTDAHGIYWSGGAKNPSLGVGRKITVRSWKEKTSRP